MNGYFYYDSRRAEVLHVPKVFIVIGYNPRRREVILDPPELKRRLGVFRRSKKVQRELTEVTINENDINRIIELQRRGDRKGLRSYCIDIFKYYSNQIKESNPLPKSFRLDSSGYDSEFIESQF